MSDLFAQQPVAPLAEALRPKTLDEVVGQSHLLGEGKPLRLAFQSGKPHSMIFWGPPGVGKTTLARLTATAFKCEFIALSAVFSGVKDIRAAMEQAQQNLAMGKRTILFVDEIQASISRSRMRCCPMRKAAWSPSSVPPPRTRPSR